MAEYIEREYVIKCMDDSYKNAGISAEAKAKMTRWLNKAPAADVQPVLRGKWMKNSYACPCSACGWDTGLSGTLLESIIEQFKYCPNCGADMR